MSPQARPDEPAPDLAEVVAAINRLTNAVDQVAFNLDELRRELVIPEFDEWANREGTVTSVGIAIGYILREIESRG